MKMAFLLRPAAWRTLCVRRAHEQQNLVLYNPFKGSKERNKGAYLDMVRMYEKREPKRRGHVEFIHAALKHMRDFGVHKDLDTYKALLDVLPKGRFVSTNVLQSEFMHYPKQQQCAIDLLEQMEDNGVMPDSEMQETLINVFGSRGYPLRKFGRMMYWMPKFKNLSPWPLPNPLPNESLELAKIAIKRIACVENDVTLSVFYTKEVDDSIDDTWIVSAQSPTQQKLLREEAEYHKKNATGKCDPLVVRGVYNVRLKEHAINYYTLIHTYRAVEVPEENLDDVSDIKFPNVMGRTVLPALPPSIHEQDDGVILAVCATGSSSRDSLLSWIRLLAINGNPEIKNLPVIFQLVSPPTELILPDKIPQLT